MPDCVRTAHAPCVGAHSGCVLQGTPTSLIRPLFCTNPLFLGLRHARALQDAHEFYLSALSALCPATIKPPNGASQNGGMVAVPGAAAGSFLPAGAALGNGLRPNGMADGPLPASGAASRQVFEQGDRSGVRVEGGAGRWVEGWWHKWEG